MFVAPFDDDGRKTIRAADPRRHRECECCWIKMPDGRLGERDLGSTAGIDLYPKSRVKFTSRSPSLNVKLHLEPASDSRFSDGIILHIRPIFKITSHCSLFSSIKHLQFFVVVVEPFPSDPGRREHCR